VEAAPVLLDAYWQTDGRPTTPVETRERS
jgi:hypothetical protein